MSELFKIIIKPIKEKKIKELDPIKIEALKEKRRIQRDEKKNRPKTDEIKPKLEKKSKEEIENFNKTLKNIVGFSVDEINEKLTQKISNIQLGQTEVEPILETKVKKTKKNKL